MFAKVFLNASHGLNRLHLSVVVAVVRMLLHMLLAPFAFEERYACPDKVNYIGWIEVPRVGVLAFRKPNNRLQYRW